MSDHPGSPFTGRFRSENEPPGHKILTSNTWSIAPGHSFVKSTPSGNTTVPINEPADSNPYQRCSIVTAISEHGPYHPFLNQQTRKRCISARQKRSDLLPSPTSCRISNYFPRWHTISNLPSLRIKRYPNEHWFSIYNRIGAPQSKFLLSKGVMVRERCELLQICNQIARSALRRQLEHI